MVFAVLTDILRNIVDIGKLLVLKVNRKMNNKQISMTLLLEKDYFLLHKVGLGMTLSKKAKSMDGLVSEIMKLIKDMSEFFLTEK